eukprot:1150446-Pelagomonas_calceolata.AAC.6
MQGQVHQGKSECRAMATTPELQCRAVFAETVRVQEDNWMQGHVCGEKACMHDHILEERTKDHTGPSYP